MSDIRMTLEGDLTIAANDLAVDDGLETAVLVSLFSDRRLEDGDDLPSGEADRRGWWGDTQDDRIGSRLWTLARSKQTPQVVARAEEYAREALAWLVEDRVAESVAVTASNPSPGVLQLAVAVRRPGGDEASYRYSYTWAAQSARRIS